jgi:hypothetical protein
VRSNSGIQASNVEKPLETCDSNLITGTEYDFHHVKGISTISQKFRLCERLLIQCSNNLTSTPKS